MTDVLGKFTAEATAGLFSTEDGAQDFTRWLQNESGYTAAQKKTVLQKAAELFEKIINRIKALLQDGVLSSTAMDFAEAQADEAAKLRQVFLQALDGMEVAEGSTEQSGEKFSLQQDEDGYFVHVDTDQHLFDGKTLDEIRKIARKVINKRFKGKVFVVGSSGKAYVDKGSASEYAYSANPRIDKAYKNVKYRAATELDNLLLVSDYLRHDDDDGHHPEATGGWDVYKTRFALNNLMLTGEVKIKATDRGYVFHDITKIDEVIRTNGQPKNSGAASDNLTNNSISQTGVNVKQKQLDIINQL